MSKVVLLLGPSGIGKTKLAKQVEAENTNWKCLDLDDLAKNFSNGIYSAQFIHDKKNCGPDMFLYICYCELKKTISLDSGSDYVVAVGSGCYDAEKVLEMLKEFKTVLITADYEEGWLRIKNGRDDGRSVEKYKEEEFSYIRSKIYESATAKLDTTGLTEALSTDKLSEILEKI